MRKDDGRVVPAFVTQALNNEPLTVFGDGSQTRSFCYVSDMIGGIYKLMMSDEAEPVNLDSSDEMSILDFAKEVIEIIGSNSEITFKPLPTNDPKVRHADIDKAKKILNWSPRVSRREGILKVVDYFRSREELSGGFS